MAAPRPSAYGSTRWTGSEGVGTGRRPLPALGAVERRLAAAAYAEALPANPDLTFEAWAAGSILFSDLARLSAGEPSWDAGASEAVATRQDQTTAVGFPRYFDVAGLDSLSLLPRRRRALSSATDRNLTTAAAAASPMADLADVATAMRDIYAMSLGADPSVTPSVRRSIARPDVASPFWTKSSTATSSTSSSSSSASPSAASASYDYEYIDDPGGVTSPPPHSPPPVAAIEDAQAADLVGAVPLEPRDDRETAGGGIGGDDNQPPRGDDHAFDAQADRSLLETEAGANAIPPLEPGEVLEEVGTAAGQQAATYVAEAVIQPSHMWRFREPFTTTSYRLYVAFHNLHMVRRLMLGVILLLGFVEQPMWCWGAALTCTEAVTPAGNFTMARSSVPVWPVSTTLTIEMIALAVLLLAGPLLRLTFVEAKYMLPWPAFNGALVLVSAIDVGFAFAFSTRGWRLSPWLRPLFLMTFSSWTRSAFLTALVSVPAVLSVLFFGTVTFVFLVWTGIMLFHGTAGGAAFETFVNAVVTLHITVTTANFPDVMVPQYAHSSWVIIYYVVFFVLMLYLMIPLLLAGIYGSYRESLLGAARSVMARRRTCLNAAYDALDPAGRGRIRYGNLVRVFQHLNVLAMVPYMSGERTSKILRRLDADRTQTITRREFSALLRVMTSSASRRRPRPMARSCCPTWYGSPSFKTFSEAVLSPRFAGVIDVIVILQVVLMAIETAHLVGTDGRPDSLLGLIDALAVAVFVVEMGVKMFLLGWAAYWATGVNLWDGSVTLVSGVATVIVLVPNAVSDPSIFRVIALFRLGRLFRLLGRFPAFRVYVNCYVRLLPQLSRVAVFILGLYYLFALFGMQRYGGVVFRGNPALAGTGFEAAGYFHVAHWNDMFGAFSTLFQLMIVNNWFIIAEGVEVPLSAWERAFFVAWWVVMYLYAVNIFVAMVIEAISASYKLERELEKGAADAPRSGSGSAWSGDGDGDGRGGGGSEDEARAEREVPLDRRRDLYSILGFEVDDVEAAELADGGPSV